MLVAALLRASFSPALQTSLQLGHCGAPRLAFARVYRV
ncbi:MAG: hypothetical protein ACI9U2_005002, partial [Bradymonadia bacterium]